MSLSSPQFLISRLQRRSPLGRLLWWDMLLVGTTLNLAAGALALVAYLHGASIWLAGAVFLSPLPWNVLLTAAVWRAAQTQPAPRRRLVRFAAFVWLGAMLFV